MKPTITDKRGRLPKKNKKGFYIYEPNYEKRFWQFVKKESNGCWIWTGSNDGRYGRFCFNYKIRTTHRIAYELSRRVKLKSSELICHKCDNPPCVRPTHLFKGTISDNAKDMIKKGRGYFQKNPDKIPRGEKSKCSRLKTKEVIFIKKSMINKTMNALSLSKKFNVTRSYIYDLAKNKSWKHIK